MLEGHRDRGASGDFSEVPQWSPTMGTDSGFFGGMSVERRFVWL
jgi:hypothetical protein